MPRPSANWDGFIEAAVKRLSNGSPGILQVIVDPNQLREPQAQAKLLKFHGCIVYADQEPATFRKYLTGSRTQITEWRNNPDFQAMVNAMTENRLARLKAAAGLRRARAS